MFVIGVNLHYLFRVTNPRAQTEKRGEYDIYEARLKAGAGPRLVGAVAGGFSERVHLVVTRVHSAVLILGCPSFE